MLVASGRQPHNVRYAHPPRAGQQLARACKAISQASAFWRCGSPGECGASGPRQTARASRHAARASATETRRRNIFTFAGLKHVFQPGSPTYLGDYYERVHSVVVAVVSTDMPAGWVAGDTRTHLLGLRGPCVFGGPALGLSFAAPRSLYAHDIYDEHSPIYNVRPVCRLASNASLACNTPSKRHDPKTGTDELGAARHSARSCDLA